MKIYFCEKCGISIPLQEVVGGRATARDGKTYCRNCHPSGGQEEGDLRLYFCDNCKVSIPLQDVITNRARAVGDQMLCPECAELPEEERLLRRDRIRDELKEREENRYRLHFCARCNTSIPQSHLVTGRATMRGGRTICERCRPRLERRLVSTVALATGLLLVLGLLFAGGYVLLDRLDRTEAAETQADPLVLRAESLAREMEERFSAQDRDREEIARLTARVATMAAGQEALAGKIEDLVQFAEEVRERQDRLAVDLLARIAASDESIRALGETARELGDRVEELKRSAVEAEPMSGPDPAEDGPVPGDEAATDEPATDEPANGGDEAGMDPAESTLESAPQEIRDLVAQLEHEENGMRFAGAVELGRKGHPAAIQPLIRLLGKEKDMFVRRAAVHSLGQLDAWAAVPVLIQTLKDPVESVASMAHKTLIEITGQDFGWEEKMSSSQLRKVINRAEEWWEAQGAKGGAQKEQ